MFLGYIPKRTLASQSNGLLFEWSGSEDIPTQTTFSGGFLFSYDNESGSSISARIRVRLYDADTAVKVEQESGSYAVVGGYDLNWAWFEFDAVLETGENDFSIYSETTDGGLISDIQIVSGGKIECGIEPYSPKRTTLGSQVKSLSGTPHSILFGIEKEHSIKTVPLSKSYVSIFEEFHDSTAASENIIFDIDGSHDIHSNQKIGYVKKDSFSQVWVGPNYVQFSFTLVEIDA